MSDIFVRPYDEPHKPHKRLMATALIVLTVTAVVIGLCLWMDSRSAKKPEVKPAVQEKPVAQPAKAPVPAPAPIAAAAPIVPVAPAVPTADSKAQQLFTRAQSLARFKMRRKMPNSAFRVAGPAHGTCRTVSPAFTSLV